MSDNSSERGGFGSDLGFVLAAAGSAVGLGNIWKFPYITGEYGGGAFVLVYLLCICVVGLPLMYAELVIGRRSGLSIVGGLRKLSEHHTLGGPVSALTGGMAVAGGAMILSFYSVVAGWALHYLHGVGRPRGGGSQGAEATFGAVSGGSPSWSIAVAHRLHGASRWGWCRSGVRRGHRGRLQVADARPVRHRRRPAVRVRGHRHRWAGCLPGASSSLQTSPSCPATPCMEALGHSFFTLSLGMGAMITYGSYMPDQRRTWCAMGWRSRCSTRSWRSSRAP